MADDIFQQLLNPLNEIGLSNDLLPITIPKIALLTDDESLAQKWTSLKSDKLEIISVSTANCQSMINFSDDSDSSLIADRSVQAIIANPDTLELALSLAKILSIVVIPLIKDLVESERVQSQLREMESNPILVLSNDEQLRQNLLTRGISTLPWLITQRSPPSFDLNSFKSHTTTRQLVLLYRMSAEIGKEIVQSRPNIGFFWLGHPSGISWSNCQALSPTASWAGMIQRAKICLSPTMDEIGRNFCLTNKVPFIQYESSEYGGLKLENNTSTEWLSMIDNINANYNHYMNSMANQQEPESINTSIVDSMVDHISLVSQIIYNSSMINDDSTSSNVIEDTENSGSILTELTRTTETTEVTEVNDSPTEVNDSHAESNLGSSGEYPSNTSDQNDNSSENSQETGFDQLPLNDSILQGDNLLKSNLFDSAQYYYHSYLHRSRETRANMAYAYLGLVRCHLQSGTVNDNTLHYVQLAHLLSLEASKLNRSFNVDMEHLLVLHLLNRDHDANVLMSELDRSSTSLSVNLYLQMAQIHQDRQRYELAMHYYDRAVQVDSTEEVIMRRNQCLDEMSVASAVIIPDNQLAASSGSAVQ